MTAVASWYAVHGPNGDLSWRVTGPAEAIGAKVNMIPEEFGTSPLAYPNTGKLFPWQIKVVLENGRKVAIRTKKQWEAFNATPKRLQALDTTYPEHEGAAVFTRPMAWLAAHMLRLRQAGVRVMAECDDNYLSPSQTNIMFQASGTTDDDRDNHARSICSADGIIVSTEYLRDVYHKDLRKHFPGLPIPELHVCRNFVDERYVPTPIPKRDDGRLRVGFMGSTSHMFDMKLIYPALRAAYELGHEIVLVGIDPRYSPIEPSIQMHRDGEPWWDIEYTHIPWKLSYRGTALPLDIGLAPLIVNRHTLCKSDIKVLEYALSGAASVAQNCEVFNRTLVHGEHCLLAGSPAEFTAQMLRLINDDSLRERLVANTNQYIREERLLSKNSDEWKQAIVG